MNRPEFEALRDLPDKKIEEDIRFSSKRNLGPLFTAEGIRIQNSLGYDLRLTIKFNPETGSKNFNVHLSGVGPICRLDVDDQDHRPAGRSHKHSLHTPDCPDQNLPQVTGRSELSGKTLEDLFRDFCIMANINHTGAFHAPETQ
ncbi:MAG TPA: hypothetical protein VFT46_07340 [Holophagaceae bacterium]|nr:hypothetical protein [Holophagaceae bacterium]